MSEAARIEQANVIIALFSPGVRLEQRGKRLWFVRGSDAICAQTDGTMRRLEGRYDHLGMGDTRAACAAQILNWVRNRQRRTMGWWERMVEAGVGQERGAEILRLLRASDYENPKKTCCVICKRAQARDWCAWGAKAGPLCENGTGCQKGGQQ